MFKDGDVGLADDFIHLGNTAFEANAREDYVDAAMFTWLEILPSMLSSADG